MLSTESDRSDASPWISHPPNDYSVVLRSFPGLARPVAGARIEPPAPGRALSDVGATGWRSTAYCFSMLLRLGLSSSLNPKFDDCRKVIITIQPLQSPPQSVIDLTFVAQNIFSKIKCLLRQASYIKFMRYWKKPLKSIAIFPDLHERNATLQCIIHSRLRCLRSPSQPRPIRRVAHQSRAVVRQRATSQARMSAP